MPFTKEKKTPYDTATLSLLFFFKSIINVTSEMFTLLIIFFLKIVIPFEKKKSTLDEL